MRKIRQSDLIAVTRTKGCLLALAAVLREDCVEIMGGLKRGEPQEPGEHEAELRETKGGSEILAIDGDAVYRFGRSAGPIL